MNAPPDAPGRKPRPPLRLRRAMQRLRFISRKPETREQLFEVLDDAHKRELIHRETIETVQRVLHTETQRVRDVMIPRSQMVTVDKSWSPEEMLQVVIDSGHSRFPVIDDEPNRIAGILLVKDLLRLVNHDKRQHFNLREWFRPAVYIPESKRLPVLLQEFRKNRNHMAIVADEYGEVAGLVTIEDVLEQIVGAIEDEYDFEDEEHPIMAHKDSSYIVKGLTPIDDFNEHFHSALDEKDFDTIGGVVLQAFGRFPRAGEKIALQGFEFEVLNADSRRIHLLKVLRSDSSPPSGSDPS